MSSQFLTLLLILYGNGFIFAFWHELNSNDNFIKIKWALRLHETQHDPSLCILHCHDYVVFPLRHKIIGLHGTKAKCKTIETIKINYGSCSLFLWIYRVNYLYTRRCEAHWISGLCPQSTLHISIPKLWKC